MDRGMTQVYPVTVRRAGVGGLSAGSPDSVWIAEVPWLPDCAVAGRTFEELEAGIRDRIADAWATAATSGAGTAVIPEDDGPREAADIELQWSVDETDR